MLTVSSGASCYLRAVWLRIRITGGVLKAIKCAACTKRWLGGSTQAKARFRRGHPRDSRRAQFRPAHVRARGTSKKPIPLPVAAALAFAIALTLAVVSPNHLKVAKANLEAGSAVTSSWLWRGTSTVTQRYGCTDVPGEDTAPVGWCTYPQGPNWHHGIDIANNGHQPTPEVGCTSPYNTLPSGAGSLLFADGPATVIQAGPTSYGTIVEWKRDSDGYFIVLYHTQAIRVNTNDRLSAGQQIAQVGNNGYPTYSNGCHLHFEVRAPPGDYWNDIDPIGYLSVSAQSNGGVMAQWNGNVDVFWQGTDGQLWHKWFDGTAWNGPAAMGGSVASEPSATASIVGVFDVFWKGTDSNLWHVYKNGSSDVWHGPASLGMGPLGSGPHAVGQSNGYVDVFWRGPRGSLLHAWYDNSSWSGPATMVEQDGTGALSSEPSAVASTPGVVDVFWQSSDTNLWHAYRLQPNSVWHGPANLGMGPLGTAPHAVGQPNGNVDVFWKGTDAQVWRAYYNGNWHGPNGMGGSLASEPLPTTSGSGVLDVFWKGADNSLWHVYRNGASDSWHGPASLGMGPLGSGPRAAGQQSAVIDVAWKGTDGQLWHAYYNVAWNGPAAFGGSINTWP